MSTADALSALRQAIKNKDPITYLKGDETCSSLLPATHIQISSSIFAKSQLTRYRKPGATSSDDVYSLEALYLAWLLRNAPGADYMKQARENGLTVGFVSVTDRKQVVEWLEGKNNENESVVPLAGWLLMILYDMLIVPRRDYNSSRNASTLHNSGAPSHAFRQNSSCRFTVITIQATLRSGCS